MRLLRQVLISLDDDVKEIMEETMGEWKDRKRGAEGPVASAGGAAATIPLGPGEWDEGLGLPLCVVCQKVGLRMSRTCAPHTNASFFIGR